MKGGNYMVCFITYDLNERGQDYDNVIKAIKDSSTGVWCSYWKSSYLIKTNLSIQEVSDNITPYLDSNDRLIVIEVKNNKQGWLTEKQWNYINNNIFS